MITTLVGGTSEEKAQQTGMLASLPSGDWRDRTCVPYYLCDLEIGMAKLDLNDVAEMLSQGLMMALCAKPPRLYPRSRWTEAEETFEDIATLEACHGL